MTASPADPVNPVSHARRSSAGATNSPWNRSARGTRNGVDACSRHGFAQRCKAWWSLFGAGGDVEGLEHGRQRAGTIPGCKPERLQALRVRNLTTVQALRDIALHDCGTGRWPFGASLAGARHSFRAGSLAAPLRLSPSPGHALSLNRIGFKERRQLLGDGAGKLFHVRDRDRALVVSGYVVADADGEKLDLFSSVRSS